MSTTFYHGGTHAHSSNSTGDDADVAGDVDASPGIWIDDGADVTVTGGTITGGNGEPGNGPSHGLVAFESALTISGGTFTGGASGPNVGGLGALVLLPAALDIDGGDFVGGAASGDMNGATALSVSLMSLSGYITDGTFTPGSPSGTGGDGYSLGYYASGSSDLVISGGQFNGDIAIYLQPDSRLTFLGLIDTFETDHIAGTLQNGDTIDCTLVAVGGTVSTIGTQPVNGVRYWG